MLYTCSVASAHITIDFYITFPIQHCQTTTEAVWSYSAGKDSPSGLDLAHKIMIERVNLIP